MSWRLPGWAIEEQTHRRGFDTLAEAVDFRARLERHERELDHGAVYLVRIDMLHDRFRERWIEVAGNDERPELWQPKPVDP